MTNNQMTVKIMKFAILNGFDGVKKTNITYKGYEVWKPYFKGKEPMHSGLPISVLVKGNEIRFTNEEETFEVFDLLHPEG